MIYNSFLNLIMEDSFSFAFTIIYVFYIWCLLYYCNKSYFVKSCIPQRENNFIYYFIEYIIKNSYLLGISIILYELFRSCPHWKDINMYDFSLFFLNHYLFPTSIVNSIILWLGLFKQRIIKIPYYNNIIKLNIILIFYRILEPLNILAILGTKKSFTKSFDNLFEVLLGLYCIITYIILAIINKKSQNVVFKEAFLWSLVKIVIFLFSLFYSEYNKDIIFLPYWIWK